MAQIEPTTEKKDHRPVNGASWNEETTPSAAPRATRKIPKKPARHGKPAFSVRYFLAGNASGDPPHLSEERASEVEAIAEAFRKQVSFFVVQEFTVEVDNHNGAPLLRKAPVKDRPSPS